jgi:hypothetical protein
LRSTFAIRAVEAAPVFALDGLESFGDTLDVDRLIAVGIVGAIGLRQFGLTAGATVGATKVFGPLISNRHLVSVGFYLPEHAAEHVTKSR